MRLKNELWERCRQEGTPLLEGDRAVFVWFGEEPPRLMGDFSGGEALELEQVEEDVWAREQVLPADAYMEYYYVDEQGEHVPDRFNRRKTPNGLGKTNHYFYMPQGKPTGWMMQPRASYRGHVSQVELAGGELVAGGKRTVYFYQPPVDEPAPLMVVWDGGDYLRRARLVTIVENMIAAGKIRPLALVLLENGGPARFLEYACSEATLGYLNWVVLPEARQRLNLLNPDEIPGAFGVAGASLGGLMALYTALRLPHIFGHVLAQSGSYEIDGFEFITNTLVDYGPQNPLRIWMDVGQFEGLLEANRAMHARLSARGYEVDYHEYPAGHNYPAWRDDLPGGLEWLYGIGQDL